MRRVLVVGDSLSLTRHESGLAYEQIYPVRLQRELPDDIVINGSLRGNSSETVAAEGYLTEYVRPLRPDTVVIQLGIVDCTPRLFSRGEKLALSAMNHTPGLRVVSRGIISLASRHRRTLTRWRQRCQVRPDDFDRYLRAFADEARRCNDSCRFVVVNIPCPTGVFLESNYRVEALVQQYNGLLEGLVRDFRGSLVDLYGFTRSSPGVLLADGYHLNAQAHDFLARETLIRMKTSTLEPEHHAN
jgi:lysophospholipase L1-like esterase